MNHRILFIDNSALPELYSPFEHWKPLLDFPVEVYHAPFRNDLPDLDAYTHILISGSISSVLENRSWMLNQEKMIRDAVEKGKVIIGNCFGHQLIAKALFGDGAVRRRDYPEMGWPAMKIIYDDPLFGSAGEIVYGFILHFDEVYELPADKVDVIMKSQECDNLAFKLKDYPVWGIQPHFEIGIAQGFAVIALVQGPGVPDKSFFMNPDQNAPRDSGRITRIIREFQKTAPLQ